MTKTIAQRIDEISLLLEVSQNLLKRGRSGLVDDAAGAAWRLADAGLLLRELLEESDIRCCGVQSTTGREVTLPYRGMSNGEG